MAAEERWYFTRQQIRDGAFRGGIPETEEEVIHKQQTAQIIQEMGQRLQVSQLCINTAIVYMHRFYAYHTFKKYGKREFASCSLFLAAKVEEQPRKLEHVIKVSHMCSQKDGSALDTKGDPYMQKASEIVLHENILLQTLGFDLAIDHPHTYIVRCIQLMRGSSSNMQHIHVSKDLAQTSYFMATNSLHLTTMCLHYKPTLVACVCIYLACKWGNWEMPMSREGKKWYFYIDPTVSEAQLEELSTEFLAVLDRYPSRMRRTMMIAPPSADLLEIGGSDQSRAGNLLALEANASTSSSSRRDKTMDKHEREKDRSSSRSASKPSSTTSSDEKNGAPGRPSSEMRDRIKKEHIGSSSSGPSAAAASASSVLMAGNESLPTLSISSVPNSSGKPAELIKITNTTGNAQSSAAGSDDALSSSKKWRPDGISRSLTPKEYHEYKERTKREREKMKQAARLERIQEAKQGSSNYHLFGKVDALGTGSDEASITAQGFGRLIVKRSPEADVRNANLSIRVGPVDESRPFQATTALSSGFSIGSILTPSPPTTKDGDPFCIDEEMAVFTSPSDLLVPVAPVEKEPVPIPFVATEPMKHGVVKGEHRKQRKEESKSNFKISSSLETNTELKRSLNSSFTTTEHVKKEMDNLMSGAPESGLDCGQPVRRHHSLKHSAEKPQKHRVIKQPQSSNSETITGGEDSFLPQQELNTLVPEHININLPVVADKLSEDEMRMPAVVHPSLMAEQTEVNQHPPTNLSAPVPETMYDVKVNRSFQEQHHSSNLKANSGLPAFAGDSSAIEKQFNDTNLDLRTTVKNESEDKRSKRSSSSSKHKEKRKKHDKKEKSKNHKEKIPKIKLTIPKEPINSSSAGSSKAENGGADGTNHKPKDESLVVKIKLNTGAAGGKGNKNGNLAEVIPNSQPVPETLAIKERSGLKLKITKNQESYTIGNDESKPKTKTSKESKKRSRSVANDAPLSSAEVSAAKVLKIAAVKSPKKMTNNQPMNATTVSNSSQTSIAPPAVESQNASAPRKSKSDGSGLLQHQAQHAVPPIQQASAVANNSVDFNRRSGQERENRSRGGKRGRGNMRMPLPPPGPPPMGVPQPPLHFGMAMYEQSPAAVDPYAHYYNFGHAPPFYNQQMYQEDSQMFLNHGTRGPVMRHPPMPPYPPAPPQPSRRGGNHHFTRQQQVLPQRPNSGPPLPSMPPPANPPLPPDI